MDDAQAQLDLFLGKFTSETATLARRGLATMRARLPGATIMVYDNYNALAIGFGASDRVSRAVLSLAVFPEHVTLCFLWGRTLDDPEQLLRGDGKQVRHIRLVPIDLLDDPRVERLIAQAVAQSDPPFDPRRAQSLIIKSISAKQRPRRKLGTADPANPRPRISAS
jgi:hypothetical protein